MAAEKTKEAPIDFSQDAGMGLENMNSGNMALPFVSILQKGSPQVDEASPKYTAGAKAGMLYNTVTGEVFDVAKKPLVFIVVGFKQAWPEWGDRDLGKGGFIKMHGTREILGQCKPNSKGRPALPNGNIIVDTAYYFGLIVRDDDVTEHAVISMSSSQWKIARNWNAMFSRDLLPNGMIAPAFRRKWSLTTILETKDKNTWYMWQFKAIGQVQSPKVIDVSRGFAQQVKQDSLLLANKSAAATDENGNPF